MFSTVEYAIFRVMTMMAGDISYMEIFGYIYSTDRRQILWIVYTIMTGVVIFINVAFANLLVSITISLDLSIRIYIKNRITGDIINL